MQALWSVGGSDGEGVVLVAAGGYHSVAVTSTGVFYSWGHGGEGRLGHGDEAHHARPAAVQALAGAVRAVGTGGFHTAVALKEAVQFEPGEAPRPQQSPPNPPTPSRMGRWCHLD